MPDTNPMPLPAKPAYAERAEPSIITEERALAETLHALGETIRVENELTRAALADLHAARVAWERRWGIRRADVEAV